MPSSAAAGDWCPQGCSRQLVLLTYRLSGLFTLGWAVYSLAGLFTNWLGCIPFDWAVYLWLGCIQFGRVVYRLAGLYTVWLGCYRLAGLYTVWLGCVPFGWAVYRMAGRYTVRLSCNCIGGSLPDRHSGLNLYPCVINFTHSVVSVPVTGTKFLTNDVTSQTSPAFVVKCRDLSHWTF